MRTRGCNEGYITLAGMLVVLALMFFFVARIYLGAPNQQVPDDLQPKGEGTTTADTTIEQYKRDVDAANDIQDIVNVQTKKLDKEL